MGKTNQNSFRETSKCASLEILHLCRIVLQFHFRATSEIHKNTRREKSISILTAYIYIYIQIRTFVIRDSSPDLPLERSWKVFSRKKEG